METIKAYIKRKAALAGGAVPYNVYVNGEKTASLMIGQSLTLNLPADKPSVIKVDAPSSKLNARLSKSAKVVERAVTVIPQLVKNGRVDINIHSVVKFSMWNPMEIVVDVQY